MQDSSKGAVLLVGQNLFFLGRVEAAAEPLGFEVRRATSESAFRNQLDGYPPDLVLVDLEGDESTWVGALEVLQERKPVSARIIAFGPHEQEATLERVSPEPHRTLLVWLHEGKFDHQ